MNAGENNCRSAKRCCLQTVQLDTLSNMCRPGDSVFPSCTRAAVARSAELRCRGPALNRSCNLRPGGRMKANESCEQVKVRPPQTGTAREQQLCADGCRAAALQLPSIGNTAAAIAADCCWSCCGLLLTLLLSCYVDALTAVVLCRALSRVVDALANFTFRHFLILPVLPAARRTAYPQAAAV